MRETHEWTDAELAYLESFYVLRGGAFIRAKYPMLTPNAIRQMATRLNLHDDLREYTPLRVVAREAGITEHSIREWLRARLWARKRCVKQGRTLMLPLPVVRLLLPSMRRPARPRGWLGSEQAADRLGVNGSLVRRLCLTGVLEAVQVRGEWFVDPSCLPARKPTQPPPNHISVQALAAASGVNARAWHAGVEKVTVKRPVGRPAAFTHEKQARAFLSARGHRGEQVETVLRRAVALDVARVKI